MRLLAPAKINLHLRVGPPRADGFHPICSWMCTVGLFDTLLIDPSPGRGIEFVCDDAALSGPDNLVPRAARELAQRLVDSATPSAPLSARIRLLKQIPAGAGLGGGSSDAAAALRGLNVLWGAGLDMSRLEQIGVTLGSDVPFFFRAPSAICRGRGEIVTAAPPPAFAYAVLILPVRAMPTASVYKRFDQLSLGRAATVAAEPDWKQWSALSAKELLPSLVNDLEAAAFAIDPELGRLRAELEQNIGRIVRMSGSGSSLFSLFDEKSEAQACAAALAQRQQVKAIAVEIGRAPDDDRNSASKFR